MARESKSKKVATKPVRTRKTAKSVNSKSKDGPRGIVFIGGPFPYGENPEMKAAPAPEIKSGCGGSSTAPPDMQGCSSPCPTPPGSGSAGIPPFTQNRHNAEAAGRIARDESLSTRLSRIEGDLGSLENSQRYNDQSFWRRIQSLEETFTKYLQAANRRIEKLEIALYGETREGV